MRVVTSFFAIVESPPFFLDHPVYGAPNDSTPAAVKDAMNAHRDWLSLHEGENRIALLGKPIPRCRPMRGKAHLNVLFSTILIE